MNKYLLLLLAFAVVLIQGDDGGPISMQTALLRKDAAMARRLNVNVSVVKAGNKNLKKAAKLKKRAKLVTKMSKKETGKKKRTMKKNAKALNRYSYKHIKKAAVPVKVIIKKNSGDKILKKLAKKSIKSPISMRRAQGIALKKAINVAKKSTKKARKCKKVAAIAAKRAAAILGRNAAVKKAATVAAKKAASISMKKAAAAAAKSAPAPEQATAAKATKSEVSPKK